MIRFRRLSFSNLLSVGNQPVSIDLDTHKTTLVHGTNGSGKSSILDALCYGLFGKSFRGVNLSQLINTQNKKKMLVEVEFSIGNDDYMVRRGQKPKVFEVWRNGEVFDSKAADKDNQAHLENIILKLTFKSFTQIVILGSSNFIPFMQLNTVGRRECVEDFLDIKVFSTMSLIAKERLRGLKEQLRGLENEIGAHEFRLQVQVDKLRDMEQRDDKQIEELNDKIKSLGQELIESEKRMDIFTENETHLKKELNSLEEEKVTTKIRQLNNVLIKMGAQVERLEKDKEFYETNDVCHTCNQDIAEDVKEEYIAVSSRKIGEITGASFQAQDMLQVQQKTFDKIQELHQLLREEWTSISHEKTTLQFTTRQMREAKDKIDELKSDTSSIEKEEGRLEEMMMEVSDLKRSRDNLVTEIANHDVVTGLLRDSGIKTHIVRKYLPAMNKSIRTYLSELDLPIHFQLDSEFNEQVRSPLHQDFSYQSFSEGQKGRIDLALMFTWREIGRLKNSVSTNILFLDEVFSSSLDETGKECLLTILRYKLPDNQRVVVVDHTLSGAFKDKFDNAIEVTRTSGFSRYN